MRRGGPRAAQPPAGAGAVAEGLEAHPQVVGEGRQHLVQDAGQVEGLRQQLARAGAGRRGPRRAVSVPAGTPPGSARSRRRPRRPRRADAASGVPRRAAHGATVHGSAISSVSRQPGSALEAGGQGGRPQQVGRRRLQRVAHVTTFQRGCRRCHGPMSGISVRLAAVSTAPSYARWQRARVGARDRAGGSAGEDGYHGRMRNPDDRHGRSRRRGGRACSLWAVTAATVLAVAALATAPRVGVALQALLLDAAFAAGEVSVPAAAPVAAAYEGSGPFELWPGTGVTRHRGRAGVAVGRGGARALGERLRRPTPRRRRRLDRVARGREPGGGSRHARRAVLHPLAEAELGRALLRLGIDDGRRAADWPTQAANNPGQPVQPIVGMFVTLPVKLVQGAGPRRVGERVVAGLATLLARGRRRGRARSDRQRAARGGARGGADRPRVAGVAGGVLRGLGARDAALERRLTGAGGPGGGRRRRRPAGRRLAGRRPRGAAPRRPARTLAALAERGYPGASTPWRRCSRRPWRVPGSRRGAWIDALDARAHRRYALWAWVFGVVACCCSRSRPAARGAGGVGAGRAAARRRWPWLWLWWGWSAGGAASAAAEALRARSPRAARRHAAGPRTARGLRRRRRHRGAGRRRGLGRLVGGAPGGWRGRPWRSCRWRWPPRAPPSWRPPC